MPETDQPGFVSIWIGRHRHGPEVEILRDLCGVEHYDTDFQECVIGKNWSEESLASLIDSLSYSASFKDQAIEAARKKGISNALWLIAQYDLAVAPETEGHHRNDVTFLGTFAWSN
jgi:hypothetical protein